MNEVEIFINNYFYEIQKINNHHLYQINEYKLEYPKIDYFKLYYFINSATNFLIDLEPKLLNNLGSKLFNDINSLYHFYKKFEKKSMYSSNIYYSEFLNTLKTYKKLKKEYDELKKSINHLNNIIKLQEEKLKIVTDVNSNDFKAIKKKYVDAIYELSLHRDKFKEIVSRIEEIEKKHKLEFFDKFEKERKKTLLQLKKIISLKLYYYEPLLWFLAKKSNTINDFFINSDIEGEYSTKLFIKYFLKNIDINKSNNNEWLNYLKDILKVFE